MFQGDPDRLLPIEPNARAIAGRLYGQVRAAPIVSPHGHVDPRLLLADEPFPNPSQLLITPDHYVTRLLHANGASLDELGLGPEPGPPREAWRVLARTWPRLAGTPVRYWLEDQFRTLFGIEDFGPATADESYDQLAELLATDSFRPRALLRRFGVAVLATTDDPADDLSAHARLNADPSIETLVVPTFRPDRYLDPAAPSWLADLARLAEASGIDTGTHAGLVAALAARRRHFVEHGATSIDIGSADAGVEPLSPVEAERIHRDARAGSLTAQAAQAYRRAMVYAMAEQSVGDGLVMQLHAGVLRNHHRPTLDRYGPDSGHDLPVPVEFTRPLRRLLNDFGTHPRFRLILFTLDEMAFARDLGPLAGFYPSVYVGAPWWFLDTPDATARFRAAVTDSAGFYKTSGFVDDTRALCSIPTRHDMSRRADAAYLAALVARGQLAEAEAAVIAADLVDAIPRKAFKLDGGLG